ncbi:DNA recombination protein RmuC [Rhodovulum sp. DZ06]|uniref:DNA recombination protein RmuC n=1 Tax=Rhodovulum sp. DZ06 TaxID=3425126 RepID=UPI003D34B482
MDALAPYLSAIQDEPLIPALAALALLALMLAARAQGGARRALAQMEDERDGALAALAEARADAARAPALAAERDRLADRLDGMGERLSAAAAHAAALEARAERIAPLETRLARLEEERDALRAARDAALRKVTALEAAAEAEAAARAAHEARLADLRAQVDDRLAKLADDALARSQDRLANTHGAALGGVVGPLKQQLDGFQKQLAMANEGAARDRERLKAEIDQLSRRSADLAKDARDLAQALKGDTRAQGAWGEMVLETLLERSGLRKGEEYEVQAHRIAADGSRLRPDVVLRLPGGRTLVIDSKVSLTAYAEAMAAEDEETAAAARARHLASVRSHVDRLGAKAYQEAEARSAEYVVMFMPIEGALAEALRADGALTAHALEKGVTIATPTTLMMALRTIESVWSIERRNANADAIAERAGRLYDKMVLAVENLDRAGASIARAADSHRTAMAQLSTGQGSVLSQVETLRKLGARTAKRLAPAAAGGAELQDPEETPAPEAAE